MDSARHVIGCRLTQETRVPNAFDDGASTVHQSLGVGCCGDGGQGRDGWIVLATSSNALSTLVS